VVAQRSLGSAMSAKQLARTVVDGRLLTFCFLGPMGDGGPILCGYLAGADDFHWLIVTAEGRKVLVHKGSAATIWFGDESTFVDEPEHEVLEAIVRPFREFLISENLAPDKKRVDILK
jgi:hypothetical protein